MKTLIKNGWIITPDRISEGALVLEGGKIAGILPLGAELPSDAEVIDAEGNYVSPGFIDMHTHGAGGADFMDGTLEAYRTAARMHARHGTTLLFPTTLTSTNEQLYETFDIYHEAASRPSPDGAALGGLHLEGPYFAPSQKGAQDPRYLRNPEPKEYMEILSRTDEIARWSLAPELPGALEFARVLRERGIQVSMAHTDATFEEAEAAFRAGFTHLTHFYSCMSTVTRRNAYRYAGVIEFGYYEDGVTAEIIGDGIHVPKSLIKLIYKLKGPKRLALVTDSMRAAGMPEGPSILGGLADGQEVLVEDGVAKLMDRSAFAGSVATDDRCVRTMVQIGEIPLREAVRMMTLTPAEIMGVASSKGSLEKGKDADIAIFDEGINVKRTMVAGRTVWAAR